MTSGPQFEVSVPKISVKTSGFSGHGRSSLTHSFASKEERLNPPPPELPQDVAIGGVTQATGEGADRKSVV